VSINSLCLVETLPLVDSHYLVYVTTSILPVCTSNYIGSKQDNLYISYVYAKENFGTIYADLFLSDQNIIF
jgi:hypothetical protein